MLKIARHLTGDFLWKMTKLHFGIATIGYFGAAILTGGMIFLGNSYHKLADSNKALSADVQSLVEAYLTSDKDCYLLAPKPKDWLIWEEMPHKTLLN